MMITRRYWAAEDIDGEPVSIIRTRPFTSTELADMYENAVKEDGGRLRGFPQNVMVGFDN
jgi:hypothetical protein